MENRRPPVENRSGRDEKISYHMKLTYNPSEEDLHPFSIVPEEIWLQIFSELKEPQDVESCFRTCNMWRDILMKQRSSFLFPKILPLLTSKNLLTFDNIMESCRGVSKMWKYCSDKHLKNIHPHSFIASVENNVFSEVDFVYDLKERINSWDGPYFHLTETTCINRITQEVTGFNLPNFNPFLKKFPSLFGTFRASEYHPNMLTWKFILDSFLPKYGIHIEHLKMNVICHVDYIIENITMLTNCLKLLPNLHSFNLHLGHNYTVEKTQELQLLLAKLPNQLPDLNLLKVVKFNNVPSPLVIHFLEKYKSIEKLQLTRYHYHHNYLKPMEGSNTQNIRQLSILVTEENQLEWLASLKWPLETLDILLAFQELSNLDPVFHMLSNFSQTLKKLTINFKCRWIPSQESNVNNLRLPLPSLKTLTIVGDNDTFFPNTIDFILPMTSLEELNIARKDDGYVRDFAEEKRIFKLKSFNLDRNHDPPMSDETRWLLIDQVNIREREMQESRPEAQISEVNIIQFYNYFERMYESNVWKLMPKLRRISVVWRTNSTNGNRNIISGPFFYLREKLPKKL